MRKIVTTDKGYTLILDKKKDKIDCVAFETDKHMSGQEIADMLNISRSAVSQSLKRSFKRVFNLFKNINKECSNIEIVCIMTKIFNIKSDIQYKKFFNLLPNNIKGEINATAYKNGYINA